MWMRRKKGDVENLGDTFQSIIRVWTVAGYDVVTKHHATSTKTREINENTGRSTGSTTVR